MLWKENTYSLLVRVESGTAILEIVCRLLKKLDIDLLQDPAVGLLDIDPKDMISY